MARQGHNAVPTVLLTAASITNPAPKQPPSLVINQGFGTREHTAQVAKLFVGFGKESLFITMTDVVLTFVVGAMSVHQ